MKPPRSSKLTVRQASWARLRRSGSARFPFPIENRIPNFKGAESAARRLADEPFFKKARVLKCNPDSPQLPLRYLALCEGKVIYMAVPRLRQERCFMRLDPGKISPDLYRKAASISGSAKFGEPVSPFDLPPIDLVCVGSVAVSPTGARVGKGGGYSDLEFAIAKTLGCVTPKTRVVSTVHDCQVVTQDWDVQPHDVPLDFIVTPTSTLACKPRHPRPKGILWKTLDPDMRRDIPILDALEEK